MRIIRSVRSMQRLGQNWLRRGIKVGFVPTMGYLHEGHMSLIRRARAAVGTEGQVVVSIYVNPTQFAPSEDLAKYPRDLPRDTALCRSAGTDVLFVPTDSEVYPADAQAPFSTYVVEEDLGRSMEGASRPTHFRGVTTVVAKLFHLVQPTVAVFGQKDYQQAAVIHRMVRDLNFPVRIVVAPTVREKDGLAMSSRNKYLTPDERRQAVVLWQAIQRARQRVQAGKVPAAGLEKELLALIGQAPAARVDYIRFFDPATLKPVSEAGRGTHLALAVYIGHTRLIDNARL